MLMQILKRRVWGNTGKHQGARPATRSEERGRPHHLLLRFEGLGLRRQNEQRRATPRQGRAFEKHVCLICSPEMVCSLECRVWGAEWRVHLGLNLGWRRGCKGREIDELEQLELGGFELPESKSQHQDGVVPTPQDVDLRIVSQPGRDRTSARPRQN